MALQQHNIAAGQLQDRLDQALQDLHANRVVERILDRDHTVWKPSPEEISNRLGWLDSPVAMAQEIPSIERFVEEIRSAGYTHVLLLGMGGSSLAPEVFRRVFGVRDGYLDVRVLDSTDPTAVRNAFDVSDPERTLYVPATKSGGTVETLSFLKYCYRRAWDAVGSTVGVHFVAITDPGSGLADLATELKFRHIFLNDPNIGGRYSALSLFGLVPAALGGADIGALLRSAREAIDELTTDSTGAPAILLGALMGICAQAGRDKLTLTGSTSLQPMGAWIEQLIAESTGKQGLGIVPIEGEPVVPADSYGDDRLFVISQLTSQTVDEGQLQGLTQAGHPVARISVPNRYDVGAEMVRWEVATVIAGHLLDINPFDQPDVESAKIQSRTVVNTYQLKGALPVTPPAFVEGGIEVSGDTSQSTLCDTLRHLLETTASDSSYVALQAYLPPSCETDAALYRIRKRILDISGRATTSGYGPRFLHSTGQLHKGDDGRGLFIQLTCAETDDVAIPDSAHADSSTMSFGVLKKAQAMGDAQALVQGGRRVLSLHLSDSIEAGLQTLCDILDALVPE